MVALSTIVIDELGDGPASPVLEFVCIFGHDGHISFIVGPLPVLDGLEPLRHATPPPVIDYWRRDPALAASAPPSGALVAEGVHPRPDLAV